MRLFRHSRKTAKPDRKTERAEDVWESVKIDRALVVAQPP